MMEPQLSALIGLRVSHVWLSDHCALYLELGALAANGNRRDGSPRNPCGEVTVYLGTDWRLEADESIVCARLSGASERASMALTLVGLEVAAAAPVGRLPELQLQLSQHLWLTTFAQDEGDPEWTVSFNYREARHLFVRCGEVYLEVSNPSLKPTALPPRRAGKAAA